MPSATEGASLNGLDVVVGDIKRHEVVKASHHGIGEGLDLIVCHINHPNRFCTTLQGGVRELGEAVVVGTEDL